MTDQTPEDNTTPATARTVPRISREFTISLSADTQSVQLPEDVKSAVIKAEGAAIEMWPSYNDGSNDILAGVTLENSIQSSPGASDITNSYANATAEKTVKNIPDGSSFEEAQELEFNKINAKSAGTATVRIWPGDGKPNGVS